MTLDAAIERTRALQAKVDQGGHLTEPEWQEVRALIEQCGGACATAEERRAVIGRLDEPQAQELIW